MTPQPHNPSLIDRIFAMAPHCLTSRRGSTPESKEQYGNIPADYGNITDYERGVMDEEDKSKAKSTAFEKDVLLDLALHDMKISSISRRLDEIERKLYRLDQVYYYIFPDRWEQDQKFENQLDDLKYGPNPDSTKK